MGDRRQTPAGQWLDDAPDPGHKALRRALDENVGEGETADTAIARQRVWSRVQAPWAAEGGRARRWGVPLLAAAAGGAAVALAVLVAPGGPWRRAPVATAPSAPPAASAPAGPLVVPLPSAPAALTTRAAERTRHRLPRGVAVELAPATALLPGDEQAAPEVTVGEVRFSVPHQGASGRRYTVRAGDYTVAVLGTTFVVAVNGAEVNVAVETGVVEVEETATGRLLDRLERGERWSSAAPEPAPAPEPAVTAPARPTPPRRSSVARPAASARTPIVSDPASASLLLEASEARRAGNFRRALALYEQIVATGTGEADLSLFTVAEILDHDLSELRQALATWERHRARYPGSPFRADTDLSIIDVLSRLGEGRRTLDEALEFLRRHPRNERRGEVAVIAAHLERERNNCSTAVGLYQTALRERLSAADADDAVFHRAACLMTLGDRRGPEAVRAYTARYPAGRHAAEARRLTEPRARTSGER
jgi:hypothetical protein